MGIPARALLKYFTRAFAQQRVFFNINQHVNHHIRKSVIMGMNQEHPLSISQVHTYRHQQIMDTAAVMLPRPMVLKEGQMVEVS